VIRSHSMHRNFGLDVARAAAIAAVLIGHAAAVFGHLWNVVSVYYWSGYLGVELFFVLSGFLIGRILITELIEAPTWAVLRGFYARRWLRTLPAYFAVLGVLAALGRPISWPLLTFVQNFDAATLSALPISWSLAVEEWFYLVLPLLLLAVARCWYARRRTAFLACCATVVVLSLALRVVYVLRTNPTWDFGVRMQIPLRMDSLVIGVLLAALRAYRPEVYARVTAHAPALALLALSTLVAVTLYWQFGLGGGARVDQSFFARTVMFDIVSVAFAGLIAALERQWSEPATGIGTRAIAGLSVVSYSVYLVHFDAFRFVLSFRSWSAGAWASAGWLVLALVATAVATAVLYGVVERPGMMLRNRIAPRVRAPLR